MLVVNSSARHMHVSPQNLEILFGKGYELKVHKWLYQEGQFASTATVTLVGGTLYDGLGNPGVQGNLVIEGDRIAAIGPGDYVIAFPTGNLQQQDRSLLLWFDRCYNCRCRVEYLR